MSFRRNPFKGLTYTFDPVLKLCAIRRKQAHDLVSADRAEPPHEAGSVLVLAAKDTDRAAPQTLDELRRDNIAGSAILKRWSEQTPEEAARHVKIGL